MSKKAESSKTDDKDDWYLSFVHKGNSVSKKL